MRIMPASSAGRRWLCGVAAAARPARRVTFAVRGVSSLAPPLRELQASPAAQQWLKALETAPCLVCGGGGGSDSHARSRVDCAVSGFPLTCSTECDRVAAAEKSEELRVFRQIRDDLAYTTTEDAKTLLAHVLTRNQRTKRLRNVVATGASATSWETFARQFTDDPRWLDDARAVRLTSAAYTFVATLSNFLPALRTENESTLERMEVHVVGARAEAMMPRQIWQELADAHTRSTFDIKLIGDHVVQMPRKKSNALATESLGNVVLEHYSGFYHHVVAAKDGLTTSPDAYALFNPGVGHPKLKSSWRPTMEMILRSGVPALLTSFSQRDQDRDFNALREMEHVIDVDFIVPPQENPFSSRCYQLDPTDVFAPIRTNSHVMVVRGLANA